MHSADGDGAGSTALATSLGRGGSSNGWPSGLHLK